MDTPTVSDFRLQFPEFLQTSDAAVKAAIDRAEYLHSNVTYGTLLAAAHLITLDTLKSASPTPDGGLGVVRREKIGQQEVEYASNAGEHERKVWWSTTIYGRELLKLEERNTRQGFGMLIA